MNFLQDHFWWIILGGTVIVVALIGLLLFLRNQGED